MLSYCTYNGSELTVVGLQYSTLSDR